jgi:hypothetical protein
VCVCVSFTTCFGLHGHLQVCRIIYITCKTHWTIQCSRMLGYRYPSGASVATRALVLKPLLQGDQNCTLITERWALGATTSLNAQPRDLDREGTNAIWRMAPNMAGERTNKDKWMRGYSLWKASRVAIGQEPSDRYFLSVMEFEAISPPHRRLWRPTPGLNAMAVFTVVGLE